MSNTRLNRWGHSVGLRLPKSVLEAAGLTERSAVSIRLLDSGEIRLRPLRNIVPAESKCGPADSAEAVAQTCPAAGEWGADEW